MKVYLLRLICAAFVCAIVGTMTNSPGRNIRQMAAGFFLLVTTLSFPKNMKLPDFDFDSIYREASSITEAGIAQAIDAQTDIITDAYTAYILTEANALGLDVEIDVTMNDDLTPEKITLTGTASPSARETLCKAVAEELGVGEEDVIWKDLHQSSA